jgi:hypothetical protein
MCFNDVSTIGVGKLVVGFTLSRLMISLNQLLKPKAVAGLAGSCLAPDSDYLVSPRRASVCVQGTQIFKKLRWEIRSRKR